MNEPLAFILHSSVLGLGLPLPCEECTEMNHRSQKESEGQRDEVMAEVPAVIYSRAGFLFYHEYLMIPNPPAPNRSFPAGQGWR